MVFAGFVITNSETGCGAFTLTPRLVVQVCRNGMTITRDAMRAVHLGERLDEGVVTWSGNTLDKTLALITAKTTDAVTTFLDPGYVQRAVRAIESATPGTRSPTRRRRSARCRQRLRFTDAQQADILAHFIRGGDVTAGGVLHAVTSAAQTQDDADTAHEMESAGAARPGDRRRPLTTPTPGSPSYSRRGAAAISRPLEAAMTDRVVTPLRPRGPSRYTDTAALNDIHALLTTTEPGDAALADIALDPRPGPAGR